MANVDVNMIIVGVLLTLGAGFGYLWLREPQHKYWEAAAGFCGVLAGLLAYWKGSPVLSVVSVLFVVVVAIVHAVFTKSVKPPSVLALDAASVDPPASTHPVRRPRAPAEQIEPTPDELAFLFALAGEPTGSAELRAFETRMTTQHRWDRAVFNITRASTEARGWATSAGYGSDNEPYTEWLQLTDKGGRMLATQRAQGGLASPREDPRAALFAELERDMGPLLDEMRKDLGGDPFVREFIVIKRTWSYNYDPKKQIFTYYFEDHESILEKLQILENHDLLRDARFNEIDRFRFTEEFVSYLKASLTEREADERKRGVLKKG